MTGTLYALGTLETCTGFMMAALIGILFGFFLEQAGFGSSRKLTGVFYFKDMAVLKVMLTAIVVALVGYNYLVALGRLSPGQLHMPDTFWLAQSIGGLIFGIGFVMGGWCPGTALVGLASAKLDALVFLIGVMLGAILFNESFPLIQSVYEGAFAGRIFLYDTLNVPREVFIFALCLAAIAAFAGSTRIENRTGLPRGAKAGSLKNSGIAALILLIGAGGLFVVPRQTPSTGPEGVSGRSGPLFRVAQAEDHIGALELSELIMKGEKAFLLVDLRDPAEYNRFHLRGAVSVPIETLGIRAEAVLSKHGTIVLYAGETARAVQVWAQLRHWGWTDVRVLTGGMQGFWRECLTPPSLADVTDEAAAMARSAAYQERRDYFLGKGDVSEE
ncbi:MAG: YeeE/YedE family protein [Deltaproteobacteria bacterium]|nr:YeeE/YedE family protein [Deltaproteobacteria bacterium]MBW1815996.1 YeeE/YedE family protein [Deltaproteobacteria bacterium]